MYLAIYTLGLADVLVLKNYSKYCDRIRLVIVFECAIHFVRCALEHTQDWLQACVSHWVHRTTSATSCFFNESKMVKISLCQSARKLVVFYSCVMQRQIISTSWCTMTQKICMGGVSRKRFRLEALNDWTSMRFLQTWSSVNLENL